MRTASALGVALSVLLLSPLHGHAAEDPAVAGMFSEPFEPSPDEPRCWEEPDGTRVCKPAAVSVAALRDGRVLSWSGLDGWENISFVTPLEGGEAARNSRSLLLEIRGDGARFSDARPPDGGAVSPEAGKDQDPTGMLGVPGRPGDGLVGSTVGELVEGETSSPPDDPQPNDGDLFCSYQVILGDGRVLVMGGTDWYTEPDLPGRYGVIELDGIRNTRIFDPGSDRWQQVGHMKYGRWYPSAVTLPDGTVTVFGGVAKLIKSTQLSNVRRAETFDPATGRWTEDHTGAASERSLPLYPRLRLMPDGTIFFDSSGQTHNPFGQAADEATWALNGRYDPQTKTWQDLGLARFGFRGSPINVMLPLKPPYDTATILQAGGVIGPTPGTYLATPFTEEITVGPDGVTSEQTGDLVHPRWFSMGVNLPDGTVVAFSGSHADETIIPGSEIPIRQAEIYDPETKRWRAAATATRGRTYHNTALLLRDGRVLVGGHSPFPAGYGGHETAPNMEPFASSDRDPTYEIYSPPYMFRGPRPAIEGAPSRIRWGDTFTVATPDAADITSVSLIRMGANTHVLDNDQRAIVLPFEQRGSTLQVQAPPHGAVAPPGYYYLFIARDGDGGSVPSVAEIVQVGDRPTATVRRTDTRVLGNRPLAATGAGSATGLGVALLVMAAAAAGAARRFG